jgi:hypothetical protein
MDTEGKNHAEIYLKILPLQPQYILLLLLFVVNSKNKFKVNSDVHHINTRQKCNFHQDSVNLSIYKKELHSAGIKLFKSFPQSTKNLSDNPKYFKSALNNYLYTHSFYSAEEYFHVDRE